MPTLTEDQKDNIRMKFMFYDNKGDGKIPKSMLGDVIRAQNLNPTELEINKCAKEIPDERITFDQFLPIFEGIKKKDVVSTPEDFIEGLKVFDNDSNGKISSAELRHLLTTLGEKLTEEEVEQLLYESLLIDEL
ncbi:hypothetical protein SNEBB_010374 [Seison nebaliae]|nr:hypothetical protein SNEBB_010374 [Seison nebaliae]